MDLIDLSRFSKQNKNYKFIFNVINVYSQYAWSFPLKCKVSFEITPYLESILKELQLLICFTFDKGSEFKAYVTKLLQKYNVTIFLNNPYKTNAKNKVGIIERFNRTLLNKIKKYVI
jgi:IS30 family transposase